MTIKYNTTIEQNLEILKTLVECVSKIYHYDTKMIILRDIQKISEALSCRVCSVVVTNLINKC